MFAASRPVWRRALLLVLTVVVAGGALVATALARSFTIKVNKHATIKSVTGTITHGAIVVNSHGFAVYTLTGDRVHHFECTKANTCFHFWPPVTVKSAKLAAKAVGVSGKLGTVRRGRIVQLTLDGHPLYTFLFDTKKGVATGEGLATFGGVWHVRRAGKAASSSTPMAPAPMGGYPSTW